jgi:hypothetical protein
VNVGGMIALLAVQLSDGDVCPSVHFMSLAMLRVTLLA